MVDAGSRHPGEDDGRPGVLRSHSLPMVGHGDRLCGFLRGWYVTLLRNLSLLLGGRNTTGPHGRKSKGRVPTPTPVTKCYEDDNSYGPGWQGGLDPPAWVFLFLHAQPPLGQNRAVRRGPADPNTCHR